MWAAVSRIAGDAVDTDEVIVQIETDKVTIDVRAPAAGVVQGIQVRERPNPALALAPSLYLARQPTVSWTACAVEA